MTLINAILDKVNSEITNKYPSPPPVAALDGFNKKKKSNIICSCTSTPARVDCSPSKYDAGYSLRKLPGWSNRLKNIQCENLRLLMAIKNAHFTRGRVDCRWSSPPPGSMKYYKNRQTFCKNVQLQNKYIHKVLSRVTPRVRTTAELKRDWRRNRAVIVSRAQSRFVLFPPVPQETIEDPAFVPPPGIKRPRVYVTLGLHRGAELGELCVELFTDICPVTCKLFTDLLFGDGVGYGYVGTKIFRKVPHMFWSGGDVVYNNGFGCYAQRDRLVPVGAENYHLSHSMPGLLSMRVTRDDEMCGIFNITFKPLPQFDLKNVVFARVVRPSHTYSCLRPLGRGSAVEVRGARARGRRSRPNTTSLTVQPNRHRC